jgi:hypothetical protein
MQAFSGFICFDTNTNPRLAGIPTVLLEVLNTYVLFFDRHHESEKVARHLNIDIPVLKEFQKTYTLTVGSSLQYQDFPIYGNRLRSILTRMDDWRPQSYRELAIQPYKNPMEYHAFWFSGYLAIFTILSLATSIAQTYGQFKANASTP